MPTIFPYDFFVVVKAEILIHRDICSFYLLSKKDKQASKETKNTCSAGSDYLGLYCFQLWLVRCPRKPINRT